MEPNSTEYNVVFHPSIIAVLYTNTYTVAITGVSHFNRLYFESYVLIVSIPTITIMLM